MNREITLLFFGIAISSLFSFSSCKTTECWVETQSDPIIIRDTMTLHAIHYHYRDMEGVPHCAWIDEFQLPYTDTLHATFYSWQKTRPCNCAE